MSPLFGRGAQRAAEDRALRAEVDRLCALPRADLAVLLMAAFGDERPRSLRVAGDTLNLIAFSEWLVRGHARPGRHLRALQGPVRDALRSLQRAGLIEWRGSETVGAKARLRATALGRVALAHGMVRDRLEEPAD